MWEGKDAAEVPNQTWTPRSVVSTSDPNRAPKVMIDPVESRAEETFEPIRRLQPPPRLQSSSSLHLPSRPTCTWAEKQHGGTEEGKKINLRLRRAAFT